MINTLKLWTWVPATTGNAQGHWSGPTMPEKQHNVKYAIKSLGKPRVIYNIYNLPVGKYYAQVTTDFNALTSGTNQKISKLFKFNIVPTPLNAIAVEPIVPRVLFAGVDYNVTAVTDPVNSTGTIVWTTAVTNGAIWNLTSGRTSSFIIDNDRQNPAINTSTTDPGIPVDIGNSVYNVSIALGGNGKQIFSKPKKEYLGGLVAKQMAAGEGGT